MDKVVNRSYDIYRDLVLEMSTSMTTLWIKSDQAISSFNIGSRPVAQDYYAEIGGLRAILGYSL